MRKNLTLRAPEATLLRVLDGLGEELITATDEEVLAAARELGMKPEEKVSAAFAGLTYPARWQLADNFDLDIPRALLERKPPEE